jgi:hypothetical protein
MPNKILLNDSESVNYLIHGQDLCLNFSFPKSFFVIVTYNCVPKTTKFKKGSFWWFQRINLFKKTGQFNSKINVFNPILAIYTIGWGIRKIRIPLKIDKVNIQVSLPNVIDFKNTTQLGKVKLKSIGFKNVNIPIFINQKEIILANNKLQVHLPFNELDQKIIENKIN